MPQYKPGILIIFIRYIETHMYVLNFHGRIVRPSVKNFVLTDVEESNDYFVFGQVSPSFYNLSVAYPFSLYQAFCIGISSIENKYGAN